MDSSKLKNIILIVLLAVNCVFAGLLIDFRRDAAVAETRLKQELTEVFANNGITLSENVNVSVDVPEEYILARNTESELDAVESLLGHAYVYDQGGNVLYYSCRKGEARFRGTGEVDIVFSGESWDINGDVEETAREAVKKLGADPIVRSVTTGDLTTVELGWRFCGDEVFNSVMELSFSQECLLMAVGMLAFDDVLGTTGTEAMSCSTALINFLGNIQENGYECKNIYSIEAGYLISVPVSGEATLTPAWKIETDTGNYCINAVSGREESIS